MKNIIHIEPTDNSPKIILNADDGLIEFEGKSYPENTFSFYKPVLEWLEDYFENIQDKTVVNFKLTYFNSATTQVIFDILDIIQEYNHEDIEIYWFFDEDNESALEDFEDYKEEFPQLNIKPVVLQKA